MAIFTIEEIDAQMKAYKAALLSVSCGKEYSYDGKTLTKADLPEIRNTLTWLDSERSSLSNNGRRSRINKSYVRR